MSGFFWDALGKSTEGHVPILGYVAVPTLLLAINGFALTFTGMEHTLHVFASLAVILGLSHLSRDHAPSLLFFVAVVAVPLLRFEGFALAGAALIAVAIWGHWTRAIITGAVILTLVSGYAALMASLGLPLVPSSVMVKSPTTAAEVSSQYGVIFGELLTSLQASLADRQGRILAIAIVALIGGAIFARDHPQARTVACVVATASIAHFLLGRWDWFSRYEIYIMATAFAGLLIVWAPVIGTPSRRITTPGLLIFVLPFVGYTYLLDTLVTPRAARNLL
jgi:hypothetical protein